MLEIQTRVAVFGYVVGLFAFSFYSALSQPNIDVLSAISYGAQWPMHVFRLV